MGKQDDMIEFHTEINIRLIFSGRFIERVS
jgi:hypothetical protein